MTSPDNPFATPPGGGSPSPYGAPQQPYGSPQGYGPPPVPGAGYPGWQPAPQTDGRAIAVLVLAICSFVVFPVIPAIVALVLAPGALRNIAESGGRLTGEGLVRAGRIVAWINLVLIPGFILLMVLVVGVLGMAMSGSS